MSRRPGVSLQCLVMPETPVGPLTLLASSRGLREIRFGAPPALDPGSPAEPEAGQQGRSAGVHLEVARARLTWMLAPLPPVALPATGEDDFGLLVPALPGSPSAPLFPDLDLGGGTPFQLSVWHALLGIPRGELRSYGELAAGLGQGSPRSVGQAVGANPLPVLVPCHRVVASNGRLGGYSGGLVRKVRLLEIEGFRPAGPRFEAACEARFEAPPEARFKVRIESRFDSPPAAAAAKAR